MSPEWSGPDYGEHADLTRVLHALRSADPVAALHHMYPWMLDEPGWERARIGFVNTAIPLQNAGRHGELQVVAERFIHAAMAARPDEPRPIRSWRRFLPWLFPLALTAWLFTGIWVFG